MKLTKIVTAAAVVGAALGVVGAPAAVANEDVSAMVWRVVGGPWPNTHAGSNQCKIEEGAYELKHGVPAGCLLDADGNQWFLWANV